VQIVEEKNRRTGGEQEEGGVSGNKKEREKEREKREGKTTWPEVGTNQIIRFNPSA